MKLSNLGSFLSIYMLPLNGGAVGPVGPAIVLAAPVATIFNTQLIYKIISYFLL